MPKILGAVRLIVGDQQKQPHRYSRLQGSAPGMSGFPGLPDIPGIFGILGILGIS
jgi:hypothetical protein